MKTMARKSNSQSNGEAHDMLKIILNEVKILSNKIQDAQDRILTERNVCEMLGIGIKTLRSYRANGILSYSKIGNKIFYRLSDINSMLNAAKIEGDYSQN